MENDISKYIYNQAIEKMKNLPERNEQKIDYENFFKSVAYGLEKALNDFGVNCVVSIGDGGSSNIGDRFKFFVRFTDGYTLVLFYYTINKEILTITRADENYSYNSLSDLENFISDKFLTRDILRFLLEESNKISTIL